MSKIKERLKSDLKEAMRSGDTIKKNLLRVLISDIERKGNQKDEKTGEMIPFGEADIEKYLISCAKNLKGLDTEESKIEVEVLSAYLPQQMTEAEVRCLVDDLFVKLQIESKRDMGKLMKVIGDEYGNTVDRKLVSQIVNERLG